MNTRNCTVALLGIALLLMAGFAPIQDPAGARPGPGGLPDLTGALRATPGCLGIELARTASGKNVIFAWFADKKAVEGWYYGEAHQQIMDQFFPHDDEGEGAYRKPLENVPDDIGPIMCIASLTKSSGQHFKETNLPVSQIAIEFYTPLSGGLFLGSRFAPKALKVPEMADYTPKDE